METIDFSKQLKELYTARRQPQEVFADAGTFLAIEGQGQPGGELFQKLIEALYSVAYTVKFTCKFAGTVDFKVNKLECLYLSDPQQVSMDQWRWKLVVRVPKEITKKHLSEAVKAVREKKELDVSAVQLLRWKEGRALQVMHVGPYDQVGQTYAALKTYAAEQGLEIQGPAHEIYLSDPRRVAPEKLKTIVRLRIKK